MLKVFSNFIDTYFQQKYNKYNTSYDQAVNPKGGTFMHIVALSPENANAFLPLLLPETADALTAGEPITALGLADADTAIGAVAGYLSENIFQISSLYVAPDHRRLGGGWMLMNALVELLEEHASGIEISFTITQQEHRFLQAFMVAMGFHKEPSNGQNTYLTTLDKIGTAPLFSSIKSSTGTPFSKLNKRLLCHAEQVAASANAPMPKGGLLADSIDQDISAAVLEKGCIQAYILFDHTWSDGLMLSALWSQSTNPLTLPGLLRFASERLRQKFPPKTQLALQTVNDAAESLVRALLPDAVPLSYTYYLSLSGFY